MMQSINTNNYSHNDFSFSMQTSSGDKIDLLLYDEKSSEISMKSDKKSTNMSLSLSHSYGYSFNYVGNGIDENDKKEIKAAMKIIQPMLEKYFSNINKSQNSQSEAEITNKAFDINSYLPKFTNENNNKINYLNDKTLQTIDKILENTKNQNNKILKHAQKLFDKLIKQSSGFEYYS